MRVWKSWSDFRSLWLEPRASPPLRRGRMPNGWRAQSIRCRYGWPTRGCRPLAQHVGCRNVASVADAAARSWTRPPRWRSCRDTWMQRGGDDMLDDLDLAWEEQETRRRRGQPVSRQQRQRRKKEKKRGRRSFGALFIS